jgi:hypothetical protein
MSRSIDPAEPLIEQATAHLKALGYSIIPLRVMVIDPNGDFSVMDWSTLVLMASKHNTEDREVPHVAH